MTGLQAADLTMALTAGLLGGLGHCSGMCGPIVAAFSMRREEDKGSSLARAVLYNAGRVTTYTLLGALVGGLGSFVAVAAPMEGAQYALMTATGAIMAAMGLSIAGAISGATALLERHNAAVLGVARSLLVSRHIIIKYLALGLVLGLLPCGLSYTMLIGAAGSGGLLPGALRMLAFGLGTVPAMFLIGMLAGGAGNIMRGRLYRAGGAVVALMGLVYVYRGLAYYAGL